MPNALTVSTALDDADAALAELVGLPLEPTDVTEALELARRVDQLSRRIRAVQIDVIEAIDQRGLHRPDGHRSARVMVEHASHLSAREAKRRDRARRALADLPMVRAGLAAGSIGPCQVDRIALVHANPRVREELVALDAQLALLAAALTYPELDRRLKNWERQVDDEGTADAARRCHENRRARLTQDYDGGWELLGAFGTLTGAQMQSIFRAFVEAEFQADWEEARAVHGDATTVEHLARTFDQRDADAVTRIFEAAANAYAAAPGGAPIDTTVVMDNETFERELRRAAGLDPEPRTEVDLGPLPNEDEGEADRPSVHPGREVRCETYDGYVIDPAEIFAHALVGRVRRTVLGWDGVVLDQSGLHKLYTGPLRHAAMVSARTCYWPGCNVTVSRCQIDHLDPRRQGGRTNLGNGAPACGRHNRLKEHGFTVRRDPRGRLHVHRPDGTEIG